MRIPYATSDFADIRRERYFYVDKTQFIPQLDNLDFGYKYVIFLRPRRFGKSTLISTLEYYYDISRANHFDELFAGLWIHEHPTPGKNKYMVLRLDFSPVDSEGTLEEIRQSFRTHVKACMRPFITRHVSRVPAFSKLEAMIDAGENDVAGLMTTLLSMAEAAGQRVFVMIDEYDHFGNRLLSDGKQAMYDTIVRGSGFVRNFYTTLKMWTGTGTLARMFITGVSPIMLDDLSSGFNIISHISQRDAFNAMAGFTQADVERAVDTMLEGRPDLAADPRIGNREVLLKTLEEHYDGYRFSLYANERMYNSTLVLYFMREMLTTGRFPREMLDLNVRTDYGRLQRIATLSGAAGKETRAFLESILTQESLSSKLVEQFGSRTQFGRAQLVSLFYYMGMLTFAEDAAKTPEPRLIIPNRVMRELQWEYLSIAMAENDGIDIDMTDMSNALAAMAVQGDIALLVTLFRDQVIARLGNRDLIEFDEKTMKLMLLAYLSQSQVFRILSEKEFAGGYCDLFLGLPGNASAAKYAWMIEAKYVPTKATKTRIDRAFGEAYEQLDRYLADQALVAQLTLGNELKAGVLVFVGSKDVQYRPWPSATPSVETKATKKKTKGSKHA